MRSGTERDWRERSGTQSKNALKAPRAAHGSTKTPQQNSAVVCGSIAKKQRGGCRRETGQQLTGVGWGKGHGSVCARQKQAARYALPPRHAAARPCTARAGAPPAACAPAPAQALAQGLVTSAALEPGGVMKRSSLSVSVGHSVSDWPLQGRVCLEGSGASGECPFRGTGDGAGRGEGCAREGARCSLAGPVGRLQAAWLQAAGPWPAGLCATPRLPSPSHGPAGNGLGLPCHPACTLTSGCQRRQRCRSRTAASPRQLEAEEGDGAGQRWGTGVIPWRQFVWGCACGRLACMLHTRKHPSSLLPPGAHRRRSHQSRSGSAGPGNSLYV